MYELIPPTPVSELLGRWRTAIAPYSEVLGQTLGLDE